MRKLITSLFMLSCIAYLLLLQSCIINNPQPKACAVIEVKIVKISEGTSYDIMFRDSHGDRYYINRGLEQGLNLDSLNAKVLNKTVTLHLPKLALGTSEHIAQMATEDEVIFTEFD